MQKCAVLCQVVDFWLEPVYGIMNGHQRELISLNDNATLPAVISSAQLEVGAPSQVRLNALWLAPRSLNRTGESLMTRNTLHAMARVLTGWLIGLSAVFAAPILQVDSNGRLLGALGVEIQGRTYNVSFQDGNCGAAVAIFVTCPPLGWLGERQRALDASQALLDQVFVGIYDDQPMRVAGCSDTELCMVLTPWYEELNDPFNPANGLIVSSAYRLICLCLQLWAFRRTGLHWNRLRQRCIRHGHGRSKGVCRVDVCRSGTGITSQCSERAVVADARHAASNGRLIGATELRPSVPNDGAETTTFFPDRQNGLPKQTPNPGHPIDLSPSSEARRSF